VARTGSAVERHDDSPSESPSAWSRRAPVVVLALIGCAIAAYLALYQVGVTACVPDPIFGRGSEVVLTSFVARLLPVPDAALGAAAYLVEAILAAAGGSERWRTAPWLVLAFGAVVLALALTGLGLLVAQPLVFHTGCTLCLASAVISLVNAWLVRDEVLATLRYLQRAPARGCSVWRALWGAA
jgi:uncharacterized membrane protein